jgi:hypothetical protein
MIKRKQGRQQTRKESGGMSLMASTFASNCTAQIQGQNADGVEQQMAQRDVPEKVCSSKQNHPLPQTNHNHQVRTGYSFYGLYYSSFIRTIRGH